MRQGRMHVKPLERLDSVAAVVDAFGPRATLRQVAGVGSTQAITNWAARGAFPADTYFAMIDWLNARGFTADPELWGQRQSTIEAPGPTARAASST